jgi:hypothetical protein
MHHHNERKMESPVPALNYFKMVEVLHIIRTSGPIGFNKLWNQLHLVKSREVLVSYTGLLEDMGLIVTQREKFGGGFAPLRFTFSISKKGAMLLNLIETSR